MSSTGAAGRESARKAAAAAVPDPVVSDSVAAQAVPDTVGPAVSSGGALPAVSSKRDAGAEGRQQKKRKINPRAEAATTAVAKKKSKTTSERDLPRGVRKAPSGKFRSDIQWGDKQRSIGTFDTPEQASAAFMSARKERDNVELLALGADEVTALFYAAKKKVVEAVGTSVPEKRKRKVSSDQDLPTGVQTTSSGKFKSMIGLGNMQRYIGSFDTPEQASAALMSVKKDLDDANLWGLGADEVNAAFVVAKTNALEVVGAFKRDLPKGVYKERSGKFVSMIRLGGKNRYIGSFDTPEQASAAFLSVKKDRDDVNLSALGADEVTASFDAAKKNAVEAVGGTGVTIRRDQSSFHFATDEEKAKVVNAYLSRKEKGKAI